MTDSFNIADLDESVSSIIKELKIWLGPDGHDFFNEMLNIHGNISPVLMDDNIPHPVHLREGMQVRNFLRTLPECKDWDCHKLDNYWGVLVKEAIKNER